MNFKEIINADQGLINRKIFSDPDIYRLEQEKIFAKSWLFLGHISQIPNNGDYFTTYMGQEPMIVTRNSEGNIVAVINSCRHRGNRVCRLEKGTADRFTCSYHGWAYSNNGDLTNVPYLKDAYFNELEMEKWGLIPVAKLDTYKGLIFATFDENAISLSDFIGDMGWYLDIFLDRSEGGSEVVGGIHKFRIKANWKMAAENNVGDMAHSAYTHAGALKAGFGFAGSIRNVKGYQMSPGQGHGTGGNWNDEGTGNTVLANASPRVAEYLQKKLEMMEERLGTVRARHLNMIHGTVFPNFSFLYGTPTIRVLHPKGPLETEVWSWCIVDKNAPEEVKNDLRLDYLRRFGPAGTWEQDDAENWQQATETSVGVVSQRYPLNYQMGLGHEFEEDILPGKLSARISETNHREFYRNWAKWLEADE